MQVHDLKLNAAAWHAIDAGVMTAQVRLNDRDYQRGDVLILRRLLTDGDKAGWIEDQVAALRQERAPEEINRSDIGDPPEIDPDENPILVELMHVYDSGGRYGIAPGHVLLSHRRVTLAMA